MSSPIKDDEPATVARLLELLDLKDAQMSAQEDVNADLRRQLDFGVDWMLHSRGHRADGLPAPRIQLRLIDNNDHYCESVVELVLAERNGRLSRIPLEYSKRSGGGVDAGPWPEDGEVPERLLRGGNLPGSIHDALFYGEQTGLPVFFVLDESRSYHASSLRPLRLTAVPRTGR